MEKLGYKHLETDAEFIARIQKKFPWWEPIEPGWSVGRTLAGTALDFYADAVGMQRQIVEVFP